MGIEDSLLFVGGGDSRHVLADREMYVKQNVPAMAVSFSKNGRAYNFFAAARDYESVDGFVI